MKGKKIEPTQRFATPEDLLKIAKTCKSAEKSRRCIMLRMLMQGKPRKEVLETVGISQSTLQRWVKAWNERGEEALEKGKSSGRPSKLTEEGKNFLVELIEIPDKRTGKKITAIHLRGVLEKKYRDKIKRWSDSLPIKETGLCSDKNETERDTAE